MNTMTTAACVLVSAVVWGAGVQHGVALAETPGDFIVVRAESGAIGPAQVAVAPGTTIVWVNRERDPIKVIFIDEIDLACKAPANFYADLLGHYESGLIPSAGSASLCLIRPGTYTYEVRRLVSKEGVKPYEMMIPGVVVVKRE